MKQYVGISRDHSGSMVNLTRVAMKDYNDLISELKGNSIRYGVETKVSTMACSIRRGHPYSLGSTENYLENNCADISSVGRIVDYTANGNFTKLWDSVAELIQLFKRVPDYNSPDVAFLLMILTDGADNNSLTTANQIGNMIHELQLTDKWTITFRVPSDRMKKNMVSAGIPAGNILVVDYADEKNLEQATIVTSQAVMRTYSARASGIRGSSSFYADLNNVDTTTVRRELSNISKKIKVIRVTQADAGKQIQHFMQEKTGGYKLGTVFYQLTKREEVQDNKRFIVWDKNSGEYYTGVEARNLLGVPSSGTIKLVPAQNNQFEVFVQSHSVNRKLVGGTKVIVYEAQ